MSDVIGRISNLIKARLYQALDEAENPADMLDYSYERQLETLQEVRRGIAEVATARARVQAQLTRLNENAARLENQAHEAMARGRDDLARTAIERRVIIIEQARGLAIQTEDLEAQQNRLLDGEARLAAGIESFRAHKEVIKAQYSAAQARVRINEAASGLSLEMGDIQLAVQRAQDKTEQLQARAAALDELVGGAPSLALQPEATDDIARELRRLRSGDDVERQLEAIKRAQNDTPRQLHSPD